MLVRLVRETPAVHFNKLFHVLGKKHKTNGRQKGPLQSALCDSLPLADSVTVMHARTAVTPGASTGKYTALRTAV